MDRSRLTKFALVVVACGGFLALWGRQRPQNLGVKGGRLAACPDRPNCVCTQGEGDQYIPPLQLEVDPEKLIRHIQQMAEGRPRMRVQVSDPTYVHLECVSRILRFVDDLEIWIDAEQQRVHARSASRVGHSDLGVNRSRVEALFDSLVDAGLAAR